MVDTIESKDENADAVKLMTVHSSKGLEFPVVFIVGAEDSVFPLANAMLEPKLLEEERETDVCGDYESEGCAVHLSCSE